MGELENTMARILGIAGSLRKGSYNHFLMDAVAAAAPSGTTVDVATMEGIPVYDTDLEDQGMPEAVMALKERLAAADALILASPQYNWGIPGPLKNTIDWLSRPTKDVARLFRGKPVAVVGATPGMSGTLLAQAGWLTVFQGLQMRPWFEVRVTISKAATVFDAEGKVIDAAAEKNIREFIEGFAKVVSPQK